MLAVLDLEQTALDYMSATGRSNTISRETLQEYALVIVCNCASVHACSVAYFNITFLSGLDHTLLDDGTLYVSGAGLYCGESGVVFIPYDDEFRDGRWDTDMEAEVCLYELTKVNLEHVVLLAKFDRSTAVIVMDPNEVHETDKEEAARLAMRDLLLTSKSICTALSPSMHTVCRAYSPNNPIEPEGRLGGPFYTRRLLAPTAASQVYVWGTNLWNELCLSDTPNQTSVYVPVRSQILSLLGVKKLAFLGSSIAALSLEGKVYVTNDGEGKLHDDKSPRLFELECPEVIVDMVANSGLITALSDTGRLYTWDIKDEEPPYELVEVDLQSALGLENPPRFLTLSAGFGFVACIIEDVGVVMWGDLCYFPRLILVPRVSDSLESDWDVVDIGMMGQFLVIVLANGRIYTGNKYLYNYSPPLLKPYEFSEPVERVWCGLRGIFVRTRKNKLFEIHKRPELSLRDLSFLSEFERLQISSLSDLLLNPEEVKGIDASNISTIAVGCYHNIALMDNGTLYVWRIVSDEWPTTPDRLESVKINLANAVYVYANNFMSVATIIYPNEPCDTEAVSWFY